MVVTRNEEAAKTIELQVYEIKVIKATLRHYRKIFYEIERLLRSATARDNVIFGRANLMLQDNGDYLSEDIKSESDDEDK